MEKYKYTGPTILIGEHDEYELRSGMKVWAEVNINVATIKGLIRGEYELMLDTLFFDVAAKYLEPVKPEPIHFDPKDDEPHKEPFNTNDFFKELFEDIDKFPFFAEKIPFGSDTYYTPKKVRDYIREHGKENINNDGHEVGGSHYKMAIEPWDFIYANHIPFDEGSAIKYLCRHKSKNGAEDVKKAISFCEHILKTQYGEEV